MEKSLVSMSANHHLVGTVLGFGVLSRNFLAKHDSSRLARGGLTKENRKLRTLHKIQSPKQLTNNLAQLRLSHLHERNAVASLNAH